MSAPDIDQLKRRFEEVFGRPPRDFSESKPTFVETINAMSFINKLNTLERKINIIDTHISLMQEYIKNGNKELAKKIIQKDKLVRNTFWWIGGIVITQFTLGVVTVLTERSPYIASYHVVTGAALLGICTLLSFRINSKKWNEWRSH